MSAPGTVIATINAGVAQDAAGNLSEASTSTDNTVTINSPVIVVSTPGGNVTVSATGGILSSASSGPSPVPPPPGAILPYGLFTFTATTTPGGFVTFTLVLPAPVVDYVKLFGTGWLSYTWDGQTGAQISGNTVTVTIQDGGRGDSNPTVGVATDPGAPVLLAAIPATGAEHERMLTLAASLLGIGLLALAISRRRTRLLD
jgi:hypothetical protein